MSNHDGGSWAFLHARFSVAISLRCPNTCARFNCRLTRDSIGTAIEVVQTIIIDGFGLVLGASCRKKKGSALCSPTKQNLFFLTEGGEKERESRFFAVRRVACRPWRTLWVRNPEAVFARHLLSEPCQMVSPPKISCPGSIYKWGKDTYIRGRDKKFSGGRKQMFLSGVSHPYSRL